MLLRKKKERKLKRRQEKKPTCGMKTELNFAAQIGKEMGMKQAAAKRIAERFICDKINQNYYLFVLINK